MPRYQRAKPFDIVRTIKNLQDAVNKLQLRSSGQTGAWESVVTLSNGWTFQTGGYFIYRLTGRQEVQIVAYQMVAPNTFVDSQTIVTLSDAIPVSPKEITILTTSLGSSGTASPRAVFDTSGNINVTNVSASGTAIVHIPPIIIPLDI